MDWSGIRAKEIFQEVYGAKIKITPRDIGYDFEAQAPNGKIYAIEAKGTDTDSPNGRLQIKWHQIKALADARNQGKIPVLFIANKKGDYGLFVLQHSLIEEDEYYDKEGGLP